MVEKLASFSQWEKYSGAKRTGNNLPRCLEERVGSSFRPLRNRRMLVLGGVNPVYKCPRTSSSVLAIKALLPKINKLHIQLTIDNQTAVTYTNKLC